MVVKFENNISSEANFHDISCLLEKLNNNIKYYKFDQFANYPAFDKELWKNYLIKRISKIIEDPENFLFYDLSLKPIILSFKLSKWDREHFGFLVAKSNPVVVPEGANKNDVDKLIENVIKYLRSIDVKFINVRINGDDLTTINSFLNHGFMYIETIIWPVLNIKDMPSYVNNNKVRLIKGEEELSIVKEIASKYQYKRGHFHCDNKFDRNVVNSMYAKWVETSYYSEDNIAVIEYKNDIAGYFVFAIDKELQSSLGYSYGRLKSLALDDNYRGKNLGQALFHGTLELIKKMKADYIDSGYAAKNHMSAYLHSKNGFFSKYEEITLHLWL